MPDPPTNKQLSFLARLGHEGADPRTKGEASDLIEDLLNARDGSGDDAPVKPRGSLKRSCGIGCLAVLLAILLAIYLATR